ncbi:hypothetical protein VZ95_13040 [Elstera litoralis]|uniref:Uncharacterized protein n=1 Tax=Elstera litoralis TaxID=552518 RepID=A0A0F3IR19_9PROT|nr:hypothetical protein [Elstera litoralis]KJV09190.1 hypothetical protein VZ95_13040 [Elstera litoralis]
MVKRHQHAFQVLPGGAQPAQGLAETCLETVAALVSTATHTQVVLPPPRDSSLAWKSNAVHPLQSLETEYQGIVRDAARGLTDPDAHKTAESTALSQFFSFDVAVPKLLGVGPGQPYDGMAIPLIDDQLRTAIREAKAAGRAIDASLAGANVAVGPVEAALLTSWTLAMGLLRKFYRIPGSDRWRIATLDAARNALIGLDAAIRGAASWNQLQQYQHNLRVGLGALEEAVAGYASVQMIYFIESFYLYRLLIRYRLEAQTAISGEDTIKVSGELTKIITRQPWLSEWLRDKLLVLNRRLLALDPSQNILFFLKGGRAIKYLEGVPQQGENDWDTQIVINPNLPAEAWYDLYRRVQNLVLLLLQDFRLEFYTLLNHHAPEFERALVADARALPPPPDEALPDPLNPPEPPQVDVDPPVGVMPAPHRAACKSELIDVGLPRYDTIEAREQWAQLHNSLVQGPDGMPYPGYLYYINEYIAMLREVFLGRSPSAHKAPKRIERLYKLLSPQSAQLTQDLDAVVAHERALIPPTLLPQSVAVADTQQDPALRRVLLILLQQFSLAYALPADPQFAAGFDDFFTANIANAATLGAPPQDLANAIQAVVAEDTQHPERPPKWNPAYNGLVTMVGFCQWVSEQMEQHLLDRSAFLTQQKQVLSGLMAVVAGIFSTREEWELEMAMTAGSAAQLQADYTRYSHPEALDPPFVITAGFYAQNPQADPATIIEMVTAAIKPYLGSNPSLTLGPSNPVGVLRIFWATAVPLGALTYAPLVVSLAVAPQAAGWPQLAYIWGLPVLGLRDLVRAYQRQSAEIEEYGRRLRLKATTAALTEIYSRANNPEPPNPTLIALAEGRCAYLKLSSTDRANGIQGDYPPPYFPAGAFELAVTNNPDALRQSLTLPPAAPGVVRTLDLLVLNQGHGDWARFATWSAQDLTANLVAPLVASKVQARLIVLDFCLSASLLAVFTPLVAAGGQIISSVYSTTEVVMTPDVWTQLKPGLDARNQGTIATVLATRLQALAANTTGLAQLEPVHAATPEQVALHLHDHPDDRDPISIIRVLRPMGGDMRANAQNLPRLFQDLNAFKQRPLPWETVGFAEQAILAKLPRTADLFTAQVYGEMLTALRQRVTAILTESAYRIGLPIETLVPLPLFDGPNGALWDLLIQHQAGLLALAKGLRRCPTPFTRFTAPTKRLTVDDALLATPIAPEVAILLNALEPNASADATQMLTSLKDSSAVLSFDGQRNYDQP